MLNRSAKTICHAQTQLLQTYSHIQTTANAFFSIQAKASCHTNFTSNNGNLHNSI